MAKQQATKQQKEQKPKPTAGTSKRLLHKLEHAQSSQSDSARKVGKLRVRLAAAEAKLAKRAQRVEKLQARVQPAAGPEHTAEAAVEKPAAEAKTSGSASDDLQLAPLDVKASSNGDHGARSQRRRIRGK